MPEDMSNRESLKESEAVQANEKQTANSKAAKPKTVRTAAKKANAADSSGQVDKHAYMYLGPNIPGGLLFSGSVYKELPEHLADIFEKAPDIKELFVEVKDAPGFKAEMEIQGSEAFRLRQSVEPVISELLKKGVFKRGRI